MQRGASVHPRHHLEVGAVEAIHADHAGLGIEVAFVGVGGVQVVLKHGQSIQVLNLRKQTVVSILGIFFPPTTLPKVSFCKALLTVWL